MTANHFVCDPAKYCRDASCCKGGILAPGLTFGDVYRISKHTGESPESLWHSRGDIVVITQDKYEIELLAIPGLFHDPCPFLDEETAKCAVYPVRPMSCASFPLSIPLSDTDLYEEVKRAYPCVRKQGQSTRQTMWVLNLNGLMEAERKTDEMISGSGLPLVKVKRPEQYADLARTALDMQHARGPEGRSWRTERLEAAAGQATAIRSYHDYYDRLHLLLRPVLFAIHEDEIGDDIAKWQKLFGRLYGETSQEYEKLLSEASF